VHSGFWWGSPRDTDHSEDPSIEGKIILKWILKSLDWGMEGMVGIDMAQNMDGWQALVNMTKRYYEPSDSIKCGEFLE